MSKEKCDDELSETERFLKLAAQKDTEEASQLKVAREDAAKAGKEPVSAGGAVTVFHPVAPGGGRAKQDRESAGGI
jgi:hypothetical protein